MEPGPADTILHADNYGHGPAYANGRCAHCARIADLAVIARRKANERRHIAAIVGTTEWTPLYPKPDPNDGRLPESAFDWLIYRAALVCIPQGDGTLGPSMDVSRAVKDHINDLIDGYPIEFDELMGERFPKGYGPA